MGVRIRTPYKIKNPFKRLEKEDKVEKSSEKTVDKPKKEEKVEVTEETTEQKGNQTIYTYTYAYDGYQICVEADVQSVQTHNPQETIESTWGVRNVTVSGNKVTVK